eukprot:scaffold488_cov104-Isochrysis_galbana.AAC.3
MPARAARHADRLFYMAPLNALLICDGRDPGGKPPAATREWTQMLALILQRKNRASHGGRRVSAEWGGEERRGPPPPMAAFLTAASLALLCCVPAAPAGPTLTLYHHPLHAPRCSSLSVLIPTSTHPPSHRRNNLLPAQARRRQRQRTPATPPAARGPRRPGLGRHLLA